MNADAIRGAVHLDVVDSGVIVGAAGVRVVPYRQRHAARQLCLEEVPLVEEEDDGSVGKGLQKRRRVV